MILRRTRFAEYLRVALHSYNVYCGYFWRGRSLKRKEHEIPCIDGKGPDDLLGDALAKLLSPLMKELTCDFKLCPG